jgi:ribonucleoside-diphosphate reductase alpha subunit
MSYFTEEMRVTKRNGKMENVSFDKILSRIKKIGSEVGIQLNYSSLAIKVIDQLYDKIETSKIDELTAEQCASLSTQHYDYSTLASRICVSNYQKNTPSSMFQCAKKLYNYKDFEGKPAPLISTSMMDFVKKYKNEIEETIDYNRDYLIDYFGFKTLERAYLFRINGVIVERIQHMWMRVAIGIHGNIHNDKSLDLVKQTYDLMSNKYFTHATPTLFNAGTSRPQLSSCYLIAMEEDSINGIYGTLGDCAKISKWAGGIGLHIHNIRAKGSRIIGTNGTSNGIVPMLRVFNNTARYVDQCIVPNTIIYTTKGPTEIQNVIQNETQIFNSLGECETVQNVLEHPYDGDIYHIKTEHSIYPLKITNEHPVLCLDFQSRGINYDTSSREINYTMLINKIKNNEINPNWKDVKDLRLGDMLVYSIPRYEKDIPNLSEDDCYFYGLMMGNGCYKNENKFGFISFHLDFNYGHDFFETYLQNKCVHFEKQIDDKMINFKWEKNIALPIRYHDIYSECKDKRILHKWLNLPLNKMKKIIQGILSFTNEKNNQTTNFFTYSSMHKNYMESLRYLFLRLGIPCISYANVFHMTLTTIEIPKTAEICELLNIQPPVSSFNFFTFDNFIYTKITNIKKEKYYGTLYDLQMQNVHDYLIHNGIIHNGGGRRNGSFAIYLEPWHADVEDFLEMKKNHGDEELKARDLFYALWICDLFMERIKTDSDWSLFCPNEAKGLSDVYGEDFKTLFESYEAKGIARKTMKARQLWFKILDAQMETGTPYLLYKDAANLKSNQKNLGTIKSSNLCCEIMEYSDNKETAVCNLASIALPMFVNKETKSFDYDKLHEVSKVVCNNLNCVIDVNFYPTEKTQISNFKHRPIGIGVQGLADTFMLMDIAFTSEEARDINKKIFETIYHGAMEKSFENAKEIYDNSILDSNDNTPTTIGAYSSFMGSPLSQGVFQFDMWNVSPSDRYDWSILRENIMKYGVRNSLLVAPMPTASTSQILGFNECFEPFTSNLYTRRTLAGEFIVINKYLIKDLIDLGHWDENIKNNIIANKGSVQQLDFLSQHLKEKYKIVWEIPMKHVIDMSADRGAFICQSQSLNLWQEDPTYNSLTNMHFYAWKKGLKTGIYYLRRKGKHQAQQFTIEPEKKKNNTDNDNEDNNNEDNVCEMCSA